jgi:hypothetical protein
VVAQPGSYKMFQRRYFVSGDQISWQDLTGLGMSWH